MTRKSRNKAASPAAPVTPAVVDQNPKRKYLLAAVITLLVVAGGLGFYFLSTKAPPPSPAVTAAPVAPAAPAPLASAPTYVGAEVCKTCHEPEFKAWSGSHHDLAMQEANAARPFSATSPTPNSATTASNRPSSRAATSSWCAPTGRTAS
jgi:hypothetical protein